MSIDVLDCFRSDDEKVKDILKKFSENYKEFIDEKGDFYTYDKSFFIYLDGKYYEVDMNKSYWSFEDDGTIAFNVKYKGVEI